MYPASIFLNYGRFLWNSLLTEKKGQNNPSGKREKEREILGSRKSKPQRIDFIIRNGFSPLFFCLGVCAYMSENSKGSDTHIKDRKCVWGNQEKNIVTFSAL